MKQLTQNQTVTARLPNNQKSWTWSFLAMAYWGETQNQKNFTNTNFYQSQLTQLFKRIFIGWRLNFNPLSRIAPYFIILLCSTSDDFTLQGEIMLGLNG